jgi:hypothetical protein
VGGVLFCIGLACFGVLALAARKVMALERALDIGDLVVLSVFALFGALCAGMGGLFWYRGDGPFPAHSVKQPAPALPQRRVTLSHGCAAAGIIFLMLSVLVPAHYFPVVLFFLGLGLLAVSHGLTPCVERLAQLRRARDSERQL